MQRPDGSESENYQDIAAPTESQMIVPDVIEGRWLLPGDESAIVINSDMLREEHDLRVGDEVILKMGGRDTPWRIVGIVRSSLSGPTIYMNYEHYAWVMRQVGRAGNVRIITGNQDPRALNEMTARLKEHYERLGMNVSWTQTIAQIREPIMFQFNLLIVFLLIMASIIAIVGALGLTGTMSINVLERVREIAVMRAIGASSRSIMLLVIVEGALIALMSWILGGLLSVPLSRFLSHAVGMAFMQAPLSYSFSGFGLFLWLGIVTVLAVVASLLTTWNAARLTVRDALAYE